MNIRCREAAYSDLDGLSNIYIDAFNGEPWNDRWSHETAFSRLKNLIEEKESLSVVAINNFKEIVGAVIGRREVFYDGMHFQIVELFVDNNIKGLGVGRKLVEYLEEVLFKEKVRRIYLLTLKVNDTVEFYKKNEFEVVDNIIVMDKLK